jgi:hypothetical protein
MVKPVEETLLPVINVGIHISRCHNIVQPEKGILAVINPRLRLTTRPLVVAKQPRRCSIEGGHLLACLTVQGLGGELLHTPLDMSGQLASEWSEAGRVTQGRRRMLYLSIRSFTCHMVQAC